MIEERFWAKVEKTGECWEWNGAARKDGYGMIYRDGQYVSAHRLSYEMARGPLNEDGVIAHSCDNPRCVNPSHLRAVSQSENLREMRDKGRGNFVCGEAHGRAILSEDDVRSIRKDLSRGHSCRGLAKIHGVSSMTISKIGRKILWAHI